MNTTTIISNFYQEIFYNKADPRIRDKFLMGDPSNIVFIYLIYIFTIKFVLEKLMKNRKPLSFKILENFVNFLLFIVSASFFTVGSYIWFFNYNWKCEAIYRSNDSKLTLLAITSSHLYLLSKFLYTLESVLLTLRKCNSFMNTYLLIHHSLYPIAIWSVINYFPSGHAIFTGFVNSFCHMILFGFQLIADNFLLEFKLFRHKTVVGFALLIFQIVAVLIHTFQLYFNNECNFPMAFPNIVSLYGVLSLLLCLIIVLPKIVERKSKKALRSNNVSFLSFNIEMFEK